MRAAASHAHNPDRMDSVSPIANAGLVAVDGRAYTLRWARIRALADNGMARSILEQHFDNPYDEALEVSYTLPLPADGAVVGYTVTVGETVIRGQIETRKAAKEAYRQALIDGRTAGLLEQERADTFTQSLGSIPARTAIRVEISVLHALGFTPAAAGNPATWEYRFPTVVGVRYMGSPGRVEDAEKLNPDRADGHGTPTRLDLELVLPGQEPPNPSSPSHDLTVETKDAGTVARSGASPLDRDVIVRWPASRSEVGVRIVEGDGLEGDPSRYGLLTLTPPAYPSQKQPRDLTVLIDASGSMHGAPLTHARDLAMRVLRTLDEHDRFEVCAFSTASQTLAAASTPAEPAQVKRAIQAIEALNASGGTEMVQAITSAIAREGDKAQRQIVLITDGYIGFEEEVIRSASSTHSGTPRIHTIGVGSAPNRVLLRGLARAGCGVEVLVGGAHDIEAAADTLLKATSAPILTEVTVTGPAVAAAMPGVLRDVMAGQPLRTLFELSPQGGELVIEGALAGHDTRWRRQLLVAPLAANVSDLAPTTPDAGQSTRTELPLGALYGREAVDDLEARRAIAQDRNESERLDEQIQAIGLKHRIVTRRTAMIAVAQDATVDPLAPRRQVRLKVEMPAEVSAAAVGLHPEPLMAAAVPAFMRRSRADADADAADMFAAQATPAVEHMAPSARPIELISSFSIHLCVPATVLHATETVLIIEFRLPPGGFDFKHYAADPQRRLRLSSKDTGSVGFVRIIKRFSSPLTRYDGDLTMRLALRLESTPEWPDAPIVVKLDGPQGSDFELSIDSLDPARA